MSACWWKAPIPTCQAAYQRGFTISWTVIAERRSPSSILGRTPGPDGPPCYELPPHVRQLHQVYCHDAVAATPTGAARARLDREIRELRLREPSQAPPSRVLRALRRLNLDTLVDDQLLDDLTSGDLTTAEFLHGRQTFELLEELAPILAPKRRFSICSGTFAPFTCPS